MTTVASDDNLSPPLNLRSSKAFEPINKLIMPLPTVKEEGKDKEDIIIVDKGIKKRSVSSDIMSEKRKWPKSLILTDGLPDWVVNDY